MAVTKVCCTCLSFDVEMLSLTDDDIRECLEKIINIKIELEDELLQNVCTECVLVMRKFVKFKDKCFSAFQRLREITSQSTCISETLLKAESIKLCSETIIFNNFTISNNILTIQETNFDNFTKKSDLKFENTSDIFESQTNSNIHSFKDNVKIEYSPQHVETDLHDSGTQDDLSSINNMLIKSNKFEAELLPASVCKDEEELNIEKSPQRNKFVESTKKVLVKRKQALWKSDYALQITLTKEQQKEELYKRQMSENYVRAPFKCSDCVSGFKSREKFDEHMNLHNESRGALQCDICKLRYSYSHQLQVHQRSHKMRYKCLRCGDITNNQTNGQFLSLNSWYNHMLGHTKEKLNKAPKTSAERGREFRQRKALLKQQSKQQQKPDAIVEIATGGIRSAGPSEDNQVPGPSEIRTIEKKEKSAEATRRWRERNKGVSRHQKNRRKLQPNACENTGREENSKKILLKQQSDQDLDAIVCTSSSQVKQRAGPSTINSISAVLTRRGNSQSQQQIETSERTREYRERRNDNINIES